jgi:hypothetical protein
MTVDPSSAMATTGGSSRLAASSGATARIRMPLAQMPRIGRPAANNWARCGTASS